VCGRFGVQILDWPNLTQPCKWFATASTSIKVMCCLGAMMQGWAPPTRYTLWRNTASIMKYCNIGKKLAANCVDIPSDNFRKYLSNRIQSFMFLYPTNPTEISNTILMLNPHKGSGLDGIPAKFIKLAKDILAPISAQLFNISFKLVFFPNCLKIAKVVPIYKNGDKTKLTNYKIAWKSLKLFPFIKMGIRLNLQTTHAWQKF